MKVRSENKKPTYGNPFGLNISGLGEVLVAEDLPDMLPYLVETNNSTATTHNNIAVQNDSTYEVRLKNKPSRQLYYLWVVTGNVTIVEPYDIYSKSIDVISTSLIDEDFTVTCTVNNGDIQEETSGSYTHERIAGENDVTATTISEEIAGACLYETGSTCIAVGTYKANATNATKFVWNVTGGTIISGLGTNTVQVQTSSDTDDNVHLECRVSNSVSFIDLSADYVHDRTEHIILISKITDIIENVAGSCDFVSGSPCIAQSTYTAVYENADTFVWNIVEGVGYIPGSVVIQSGQGTDSITIETSSEADETFSLRCSVSNIDNADSLIKVFTHLRTEIFDTVAVTFINESISGACDWSTPDTCIASSTYDVTAIDYDTLLWEVTGATLSSGQGTTQIVVTSDDNINTNFTVKCTATGFLGGTAFKSYSYTHSRTQILLLPEITAINESNNLGCEYDGL